jgi:hypothetical protein
VIMNGKQENELIHRRIFFPPYRRLF